MRKSKQIILTSLELVRRAGTYFWSLSRECSHLFVSFLQHKHLGVLLSDADTFQPQLHLMKSRRDHISKGMRLWVLSFRAVTHYCHDSHDLATFNKRGQKRWGRFASALTSILTFKEKPWALLEWKHFSNLLAGHWDREHSKVKGMGLPVSAHRNGSQESGGLAHSSNGTVFVGECAIMEARPLIQVFHQG